MSRSGYYDEWDGIGEQWDLIRWRGAVASAMRGKRGQAFLREMVAALEALPEKRLIRSALVTPEGCCAMGAVALARGQDVGGVDPDERDQVAEAFGIAEALAAEIAFENDEHGQWRDDYTPEQRYEHVLGWARESIEAALRRAARKGA